MMNKGKLIVIEGTDGSGKATQVKLLSAYLKENKVPFATIDFPQYYRTIFGRWIGRFLKGEFGTVEEIHPYLLMFPYAADRWQAKEKINNWLEKGKIVLCDRYAASNAYQAAKLVPKERNRFTKWSFDMEYKAFGIPKEDAVIFLYVPYQISQQLINQKSNRKYLGNSKTKDIHEANVNLLKNVEEVYLGYCKKFPHWIKIDCTQNNQILTREQIHQKIIQELKTRQFLK